MTAPGKGKTLQAKLPEVKTQARDAAGKARELFDQQAKERQRASGGDRKSNKPKSVPVDLPEPKAADARDAAGKAFGVSGKLVDHARTVRKHAIPEVSKAVEEGRMSVTTAAVLAHESEDVQRAEATKPKRNRTYTSMTEPGPAGGEQFETHADRETLRFLAVARPWLDGRGWCDPAQAG